MDPPGARPLAARLPADVLQRIFDATATEGSGRYSRRYTVLSFEERVRAEAVNKHWRAALAVQPASYVSLSVSGPARVSLIAEPNPAVLAKVAARARALAARAPAAETISLDLDFPLESSDSKAEVMAAYTASLQALFAVPGDRSLRLGVSGGSCTDMLRLLASVQSSASLASLSLTVRWAAGGSGGGAGGMMGAAGGEGGDLEPILLEPGAEGLVGLPHVSRLYIEGAHPVLLALPMPRLESLQLSGMDDEMGGIVPAGSVQLGSGGPPPGRGRRATRAPPLFPALRQVSIEVQELLLDAADAPTLDRLALALYSPTSQLELLPGASLPALASLELSAASVYSEGFLGEMGEVLPGWDIGLHSNSFAPLLAAAAASPLRSLDLCVGEALDASMKAALRRLTRLSSLRLRFADPPSMEAGWMGEGGDEFGDEFGDWGEPPAQAPAAAATEPKHAFDCRLLAGMTALEELAASDGGRLEHPDALACLPALRTLHLQDAAALPALAPHLPHLTCLALEATTPPQLAGAQAACAALRSLPGLRRLVLGTPPQVPIRPTKAVRAQDRQALASIATHLPQGCVVQAAPHF